MGWIGVRVRSAKLPYRLKTIRTFVEAKVKWVRDPDLDFVVEREKDLLQALSLKNQILSHSQSISLSAASLLKPSLNLSTSSSKFFLRYPSFFSIFQPSPSLPPRVKLTPSLLSLHSQESSILSDSVDRLSRLLMLTGASRLPLSLVDRLRWDLGLPPNFVASLLSRYPDYFQVCELQGTQELALELLSWRDELAVSELEKRNNQSNSNLPIAFPMCFPKGFELEKKVKDWVEEWQRLPYISPYENAFHLRPNSDLAEKWTVGVLHELLWLLVSKKTERDNLLCLGDYLGFGSSFKKALKHHPGIFYVSNKIRTQTVALREAYRKHFLVVKHPLMGMRYRYIHLLNRMPKTKMRKSPVAP